MMFHLFKGGVKLAQVTQSVKKRLTHRSNAHLAKQLSVQIALASVLIGAMPVRAATVTEKPSQLIAYDGSATDVRFDTNNPLGVDIVTPSPIQEKIGTSRYEDQQKQQLAALAAARARSVQTASFTVLSADPGFAAKRALAQRAAAAYGVPWQIVEAVWQVESGKSWDTTLRSSAGAIGPAQFMPATWRIYGVDADGDGATNIYDAQDAVYGAAHYLAANGANRGQVRQALLAYNHAEWYVVKVLTVARTIGYSG